MFLPVLLWLSIVSSIHLTQTPSCSSYIDTQLQDPTLEFALVKVEQYENSFSIIFSDSLYITDFYFSKSQESHSESLKNGYKKKETCQIDHQEFYVSKIRIFNQPI